MGERLALSEARLEVVGKGLWLCECVTESVSVTDCVPVPPPATPAGVPDTVRVGEGE